MSLIGSNKFLVKYKRTKYKRILAEITRILFKLTKFLNELT